MSKIILVSRDGLESEIEGMEELSIMEIIRNSGSEEMLALCGGCCSCATCHIYVDPVFIDRLPVMNADENDLLDSSDFRNETSRLSCQIHFTKILDGLRVTIAPED